MRLKALVLLVAMVSLAACGDDDEADPGPQPTATATATRAPVTGAIDFHWEGTIAGRDDVLHLEPDGTATLTSAGQPERPLDIPQPVVDHVMEDLAAADLASLDASYTGPDVEDGQVQTISAGDVEVSSENGAGPPELAAVLSDLTDIVANADNLVRFRTGVRTANGPDLATIDVTDDGVAFISDPTSGNTQAQLTTSELETVKEALDATPFETEGTPGFVDSRAPLDEDQVVLAYRWLTLKDPPPPADPAIQILRGLL